MDRVADAIEVLRQRLQHLREPTHQQRGAAVSAIGPIHVIRCHRQGRALRYDQALTTVDVPSPERRHAPSL
jgi:hypothetical protein